MESTTNLQQRKSILPKKEHLVKRRPQQKYVLKHKNKSFQDINAEMKDGVTHDKTSSTNTSRVYFKTEDDKSCMSIPDEKIPFIWREQPSRQLLPHLVTTKDDLSYFNLPISNLDSHDIVYVFEELYEVKIKDCNELIQYGPNLRFER